MIDAITAKRLENLENRLAGLEIRVGSGALALEGLEAVRRDMVALFQASAQHTERTIEAAEGRAAARWAMDAERFSAIDAQLAAILDILRR